LTLLKKKPGIYGKNSEKLEDNALYTMKAIILEDSEDWTYRETRILTLL
jgi:hypothetical protein